MMTNESTSENVLSDEQKQDFIEKGYIVLRGAFDGEEAKAWVNDELRRAGYDPDDASTWTKPYLRLPTVRRESLATFAPAAWAASCELMGGEARVKNRAGIGLFAVNLGEGADRPFEPASPQSPGWHKDGWHFRHFLDSPDQGLLGIPLLTDVLPQGGATFIAEGSVARVARFLADHPEGVLPDGFPVRDLLSAEVIFHEATGAAGDFYLCHPYLLHAVSQNVLRRVRAISNILYELNEPMNFDRADGDYSPVEEAVLHGLGVDRYPFGITGERYRTPDYGPINAKYR
ncbi:MAG: hypothetical protein SFU56_06060 [Capsulimonadales bacterium]|nr:hypothetical protein [Capsulimonadales bacterium]